MINPQKLVLIFVITWCILEIDKAFLVDLKKDSKTIRVLVHVTDFADHLEGVVRYLFWEIQTRNFFYPEIVLLFHGNDEECLKIGNLLVRDGIVSFGDDRFSPDLILYLGNSARVC